MSDEQAGDASSTWKVGGVLVGLGLFFKMNHAVVLDAEAGPTVTISHKRVEPNLGRACARLSTAGVGALFSSTYTDKVDATTTK